MTMVRFQAKGRRMQKASPSFPDTAPTVLPAVSWWAVTKRLIARLSAGDLSLIGSAVAFYALLGLFPALAAMTAVAGLVTDPDALVLELDQISEIMPPEAAGLLLGQAQAVAGQGNDRLTFCLDPERGDSSGCSAARYELPFPWFEHGLSCGGNAWIFP